MFNYFNTASETVAKTQLNISHLVHILDDFPMAASYNYHQCRIHLADFLSLCKYLGVPIREFSFARIELDTLRITALFIT